MTRMEVFSLEFFNFELICLKNCDSNVIVSSSQLESCESQVANQKALESVILNHASELIARNILENILHKIDVKLIFRFFVPN